MYNEVESLNVAFNGKRLIFEIELPHICPQCSTATDLKPIANFHIETKTDYKHLYSIFFCTHCEKIFVVYYYGNTYSLLSPVSLFPYPSEKYVFSDNILVLSPKFCEIYNQSYQAEQNGLLEICGMGYRKALEFLIKDYAIAFNHENEEKIKSQMLSQCIKDNIDNKHIQTLATASAWIGNDETHYCRKHENYNLKSLKSFIHAIVSFINSEIEVKEAEKLLHN